MMKIFLYEKAAKGVIIGGELPADFEELQPDITIGGQTLRGIKWANVDYEITDSVIPSDIVPGKYQYISGEIITNPDYIEGE